MAAPRPDYPAVVRVAHWLNVVALVALVMSGLQISNAHPALYLGDASDPRNLLLALPEFPKNATLGGWLAGGRRVHFTLAWLFVLNGLLYLGVVLATRRDRAVWPRRVDLAGVPAAIRDHLRFPPRLEGAGGGLNPLQKLAYAGVALGLGPLLVVTGLALSPAWDAAFPWWTDMLGGRQSARTWHFLGMAAFLGFVAVHLLMVAFAGPRAWLRMITGRNG